MVQPFSNGLSKQFGMYVQVSQHVCVWHIHVCTFVHVCLCVSVCIYVCMWGAVYPGTHLCVQMCPYMSAGRSMYVCVHKCPLADVCAHTPLHVPKCFHVSCMCAPVCKSL